MDEKLENIDIEFYVLYYAHETFQCLSIQILG